MKKAVIYTKENCPKCNFSKYYAEGIGLDLSERNIDEEEAHLNQLVEQGISSVPVIFIEDEAGSLTYHHTGFAPHELNNVKEQVQEG